MNRNLWINLGLIIVIVAAGIWINLPNNPGIHIGSFNRDNQIKLGLDLRGGLQVLMEADVSEDTEVSAESLDVARQIMEERSNALGVEEVTYQVAGDRRLLGQYPGATNLQEVLDTIQQVGLLEFVEMGTTAVAEGTTVETDYGTTSSTSTTATAVPTEASTVEATPAATQIETAEATTAATTEATPEATAASAEATPAATDTATAAPTVYHTVMTGSDLKEVGVSTTSLGEYVITFTLTDEGSKIFAEYTSNHVGEILGIVLDKKVISSPRIQTAITQGSGQIEGSFTQESANAMAVQLRYGSLPIPLKVVESQVIGPSLGSDSLQKSLLAGGVGLIIIILFMLIYYRLPGAMADLALVVYALITLLLYRVIPVTLTLPGIAGVLLSLGSALDANILIFERLKEELRNGRTVTQAIPIAWRRAWSSIRDSNIATLITCLILFWFGSTFGASIVKGFAITLMLGIVVSLFTALVVTRTFLTITLNTTKPTNLVRWFGI